MSKDYHEWITLCDLRDGPLDIWGGGGHFFLPDFFISSQKLCRILFFANMGLHDFFLIS